MNSVFNHHHTASSRRCYIFELEDCFLHNKNVDKTNTDTFSTSYDLISTTILSLHKVYFHCLTFDPYFLLSSYYLNLLKQIENIVHCLIVYLNFYYSLLLERYGSLVGYLRSVRQLW